MPDSEEDEASATSLIVDVHTGETVGFRYVWADGVHQPFWLNGERSSVAVVDLDEAPGREASEDSVEVEEGTKDV